MTTQLRGSGFEEPDYEQALHAFSVSQYLEKESKKRDSRIRG